MFVYRRRRYIPFFSVTLVALLYTHLWSAFFVIGARVTVARLAAGCAATSGASCCATRCSASALAFLLYLPWLPTALYQLKHTAAPWAQGPTWRAAQQIPHTLAGGWREIYITAIVAAVGIFIAWRSAMAERGPRRGLGRARAAGDDGRAGVDDLERLGRVGAALLRDLRRPVPDLASAGRSRAPA